MKSLRAPAFVLVFLGLSAALAGCEDDPMDLDYLHDAGQDAAAAGSSGEGPDSGGGGSSGGGSDASTGNDSGSDDAGSDDAGR